MRFDGALYERALASVARSRVVVRPALPEVRLMRFRESTHGTFGVLRSPGAQMFTLEPQWLNNKPGHSCIPPGRYLAVLERSPRFGRDLYELQNVPGRSEILIHAGNLAGRRDLDLITHSWGCILPGQRTGILGAQRAVLESGTAVRRLHADLAGKNFYLIVEAVQWD